MRAVIAGETFSFERVDAVLGSDAAAFVVERWSTQASIYAPGTWKAWGHAFCRFLIWLQTQAQAQEPWALQLLHALRALPAEVPPAPPIGLAIERWRDRPPTDYETTSQTPWRIARQRSLGQVLGAFRLLAKAGALPSVPRIPPAHAGQIQGNNIPSLGELIRPGGAAPSEWRELVRLNEVRLASLRKAAATMLQVELEGVRRARTDAGRITQPATTEGSLFQRLKALGLVCDYASGRISGNLTGRQLREAQAEVLAYSLRVHEGQVRRPQHTTLARQVGHLGGIRRLQEQLDGTVCSLVAAQFVILADTGLNVSVLEGLPASPFVGTVRRGQIQLDTISGVKLRAGGKVVEAHLVSPTAWVSARRPDGEMSGRQAIDTWLEISSRFRARAEAAGNTNSQLLWISRRIQGHREIIAPVSGEAYTAYLREFRKRLSADPDLGGLPIQRRMIRPTFLQREHARGGFDQLATAAVAGHASAQTTERYVGRRWLHAALEERIRHFLELFEVTLARDLAEAKDVMGLSVETWDARVAASYDTGIGFLCATPHRSPQPDVEVGERCLRVDRCADCSSRKFVASDQSVRDLVRIQRSLHAQRQDFEATHPLRWEQAWLPLLALTEAIAAKLSSGSHRYLLRRVATEIDEEIANGRLALVGLY